MSVNSKKKRDAKKKKEPKKPAKPKKPVQSFENLVANVAMKRMEDTIDRKVALATHFSQQKVAKTLLDVVSPMQVGYMVMKDMMMAGTEFTEDNWAWQETEVVDRSLGYKEVDEVAQEGDYVRLKVRTRPADEAEYADEEELLEIPNLLDISKSEEKTPTLPEIEAGVEGMKAGEEKEIKEDGDATIEPPTKGYYYKVKVYKVSRKPKAEKKKGADDGSTKPESSK